jgi:hypothetical protein
MASKRKPAGYLAFSTEGVSYIPSQKVGGPKTVYTFYGYICNIEQAGRKDWELWWAGEDHTIQSFERKRDAIEYAEAEAKSRRFTADLLDEERPL